MHALGKCSPETRNTSDDREYAENDNATLEASDEEISCRGVMGELEAMIGAAPLLANEERRAQWVETIHRVADKGMPRTVVGVLGSTGVGKSSLLNALLGEASILPTSGSRGCTATVVELQFNEQLGAADRAGHRLDVDRVRSKQ